MKSYPFFLGIDVSKKTLDLCLLISDSPAKPASLRVSNDETGHEKMLAFLRQNGMDPAHGLFVMEHTGLYSTLACLFLEKHGLSFTLLNGLDVKRSLGVHRGKDDQKDARRIAEYAYMRRAFIGPSEVRSSVLEELAMLFSTREQLIESRKRLRASLKERLDLGFSEQAAALEQSLAPALEGIEKSIKECDERTQKLINGDPALKEASDLARSVPGVGKQLAAYLLIVTHGFKRFSSPRALACHAGVAPFPYQSGTSIQGRNKVNHYCDKCLKWLLHMASLNAVRYDKELKAYYDKKVSEGKAKMLVLNAVRNKLLQRIAAVIKRKKPFVSLANHLS